MNIGSLLSIHVCMYIGFTLKTYPKLVEHMSKMNANSSLGGVGIVFLIIGVFLAGPVDGGVDFDRF